MKKTLPVAAVLFALAATAQAAPKSVLAPVVPRIKSLVGHVQPNTEFGFGHDILIGQYRTANHLIHPRDKAGRKLPPYAELGPQPGGFYLQITVASSPMQALPQTTPATADRPWATVLSTYPLPKKRAIIMTWEAAPGAPHGLAPRIGNILSLYASRIKSF